MKDWIEQQVDGLNALCGGDVARWIGIEMAVREDPKPQWFDDSVDVLQLGRLDLVISSGAVVPLVTVQDQDSTVVAWGLCRRDDLPPLELEPHEPSSIYRTRVLSELPTGRITSVNVVQKSHGVIARVSLDVQGQEVSLRPGEVYEQWDGSLRIVEMDESILVQVDGRRPRADKSD